MRAVVVLLVAAVLGFGGAGCAVTVSGEGIRSSAMEFEVTAVRQAERVGDPRDPGLSLAAEGVFVVVTLRIRNAGGDPVTFVDADQTLVDTRGEQFEVDRAADIYANPGIRSTRMEPGAELVVDIVFDVPPGVVPDVVLLRESAASAQVALPLR